MRVDTRTEAQKAFGELLSFPTPSDPIPAPKTAIINGMVFEVSYHRVNRKCYDNMPTPTLSVKVDGKRIAYSKAYKMLG
jgi:hypothetical protein